MSVSFVVSNGQITVLLLSTGKTYQMTTDNPRCVDVINAIKENESEDKIAELLESTLTLEGYVAAQKNDRVTVVNGQVYIDGEVLHGAIAGRIADFKENGLPIDHLIRFIERIADNPSYNSRNQLYNFLENKDLVITEDGHFLAYKAVRSDYMDKYSNTISNTPGSTITMDRNKIDDNPNAHCSKGLHVGAMNYVKWYGGGSDKVVIVKVDPANVVSVPGDHECQKCRVCEYTVLRDSEGVMKQPLYTTTGEPFKPESYDGGWDFAYDDIEDFDDDGEIYDYDDEYDEYDEYEDSCDEESDVEDDLPPRIWL
jgi:hypothetical protein